MTNKNPEKTDDGFPFPLPSQNQNGCEAPAVTHIRNNASYLTVGTITDKLAQAGMFMIGTLANLILLAPYFLTMSLVLGYYHFSILDNFVWSVAVTTFVLFSGSLPYQIWNSIRRKRACWPTGWWSRFLGRLIAAFLIALVLLSTNWAIEILRDQLRIVQFNLMTTLGSVFAGLSSFSILRNFVPVAGRAHKVGIFLVSLLGFIGLYAMLAVLTNFVVYGNALSIVPTWQFLFEWKERELAIGFLVTVLAIVFLLVWFPRPNTKDWQYHFVAVLMLLLFAAGFYLASESCRSFGQRAKDTSTEIGKLSRPLSLALTPLVNEANESGTEIVDRLRVLKQEISSSQEQYGSDDNLFNDGSCDNSSSEDWRNHLKPERIQVYGFVQKYLDNAVELTEVSPADQFFFRTEVAMLARKNLAKRIAAAHAWIECDSDESSAKVQSLIQQKVIEIFLKQRLEKQDIEPIATLNNADVSKLESAAFTKLKDAKVNSLWQDEFAVLTGRSEELKRIPPPLRTTSAFPGSMPILPFGSSIEDCREAIHAAMIEKFVSGLPPNRLDSANFEKFIERFPLLETAIYRERERRHLSGLDNSDLHSIVVAAQQVSAISMKPDFGGAVPTMAKFKPIYQDIQNLLENNIGKLAEIADRFEKILEQEVATNLLVSRATGIGNSEADDAIQALGLIRDPNIKKEAKDDVRLGMYAVSSKEWFSPNDLLNLIAAKYAYDRAESHQFAQLDLAVSKAAFGDFAALDSLKNLRQQMFKQSFGIKSLVFLVFAVALAGLSILIIDPNWTSLHGFYRGRLASTFLSLPAKPLAKVKISDLSPPGSVGPYLLINTVINLQNSDDLALRDQKSDFFVFTKDFCGGSRTGYTPTTILERSYPRINLATAMTISAAAVSPNMGRSTNGVAVWLMTLLNLRLGYWIPNPNCLPLSTSFQKVFQNELELRIKPRWRSQKVLRELNSDQPDVGSDLLGLAFPGGGIRSATFNLGISQALHAAGVFKHFDYLSSVSGGGYVASGIAASMANIVDSSQTQPSAIIVADQKEEAEPPRVAKWRIPLATYGMEIFSQLDEDTPWVNLTDGGHAENLAVIELLRRRCKIIVVGNAEADPKNPFNGVGTLIRLANLELGIDIDIDMSGLKLDENLVSKAHWTLGIISYPCRDGMSEGEGILVMLKSSLTGDEGEMINEYKSRKPVFPHEPTTDQFFDVGQFEAYRQLGLHVANDFISAIKSVTEVTGQPKDIGEFSNFMSALEELPDISQKNL